MRVPTTGGALIPAHPDGLLPLLKPAVTVKLELMVKEQVGDELPPEQVTPLQAVKTEPLAGVALSVTVVPETKEAFAEEQLVPQEIPDGVLVTVPLPVPDLMTVSETVGEDEVKVAITLLGPLITSEQAALPVQSPDHPEKIQPAAAVAVNAAPDPFARPNVQLLVQSAAVGVPLIRTEPFPLTVTESGTPPPNDPQLPIPDACTVTSPVTG